MDLKELQEYVDKWIRIIGEMDWTKWNYFARLVEEVGEVGEVLSIKEGHKKHKKPEDFDIEVEIGDILFVTSALANNLGVDLNNCFEKVKKKLDVQFGKMPSE
ncbi:nucleotide pyrophosphohydrolase [Patescibacteria group bacterium]|nr:nucleotide pyrophosphohydrolase [Patescibacteria group bacterium]